MSPSVYRRTPAALVALMVVLVGCGSPADSGGRTVEGVPETLRVGLVPNIAPEQQQARYQPFADYLEGDLGVTVELFVAADYAGVVAALASGRIDLAYLGGLTYVQAEAQVSLTPLVSEVDQDTGTTKYLSAVVVRDEAPYTELTDVIQDGATFAFGDVSSTSGSLYPRMMLVEAGAQCHPRDIDQCPPLGRVYFTGGHDAAALAVLGGSADAAGLELRILRRLERDGDVPEGALRVIAQREVEGYPWVMRTALGPAATQRLTAAFTAIDDPALLDLLRAQTYQPVDAGDYDEIRRFGTELGLVEAG
ncbi:MAG: phosphate/phosphite/phosphonate ABC transporter substrate-binding protein [Micromonosporaceae bacterium]|nr:phosphate/phosphite/phosphonate ABC transporter substrate-binding protein [Micromonosporaceae bacterium]